MVPGGDHRKLLTKGQDLQMEEGATAEHASQRKKRRSEERLHRKDATVREEKRSTGSSRTAFLVGTTSYDAPFAPLFRLFASAFTEGFESRDLTEASALVEKLNQIMLAVANESPDSGSHGYSFSEDSPSPTEIHPTARRYLAFGRGSARESNPRPGPAHSRGLNWAPIDKTPVAGRNLIMSDVTIVATGLGFPEGPVVCEDGSVVLTEIRNGRCSRVTADGEVSVFSDTGGGPNGLATGPDGAFYLCNNGGSRYVAGTSMGQGPHPDYKFGSIQRIDATTGTVSTLYTECNGHILSAPNDLVFDAQGGFYFTDLGKRYARHRDNGGLYYALPDGSKVVELAFPMLSPNGCGLSPDGKTLYAADTEGARLWAFDIEGPGVVRQAPPFHPHSGRVLAGLGASARFDSLAVMASGNVAVATLNTGYITEFSPAGDIVREVKMPDIYPTNICFGGNDMRTAYITLSDAGHLGVMQWPEPGLKLNFG